MLFRSFNDRLALNVGGNYVTGATFAGGQYFVGDVALEYDLTPDGRLTFRAYNRSSKSFEGHKNKVGAGLGYRREYDSLLEIFGKKKTKTPPKPPTPMQVVGKPEEPVEGG